VKPIGTNIKVTAVSDDIFCPVYQNLNTAVSTVKPNTNHIIGKGDINNNSSLAERRRLVFVSIFKVSVSIEQRARSTTTKLTRRCKRSEERA
jgi:hypothetical protein